MRLRKIRAMMSLEETLKLVLAIIGIILLLYLLTSLYGIMRRENELNMAKSILEQMKGKIDSLKLEGDLESVLVTGPGTWVIVGYNKPVPLDLCGIDVEHCLCFCPKPDENSCKKGGTCVKVDKNLDTFGIAESASENPGIYMGLRNPEDTCTKFEKPGLITLTMLYSNNRVIFYYGEINDYNKPLYSILTNSAGDKQIEKLIVDYYSQPDSLEQNKNMEEIKKQIEDYITSYLSNYPFKITVHIGPLIILNQIREISEAFSSQCTGESPRLIFNAGKEETANINNNFPIMFARFDKSVKFSSITLKPRNGPVIQFEFTNKK